MSANLQVQHSYTIIIFYYR